MGHYTRSLATKTAESDPPAALGVEAVLSLPLAEFATRHLALRVRLPDGSTCWFCSGPDEGAVLRSEGVPRGEIWTASELRDVIAAGWDRTTIGQLIAVKREFNGTVGPSSDAPTAPPTPPTNPVRPPCPCCGGVRWWKSIHGAVACGRCHPPADPSLVKEWLDDVVPPEAPGANEGEARA